MESGSGRCFEVRLGVLSEVRDSVAARLMRFKWFQNLI